MSSFFKFLYFFFIFIFQVYTCIKSKFLLTPLHHHRYASATGVDKSGGEDQRCFGSTAEELLDQGRTMLLWGVLLISLSCMGLLALKLSSKKKSSTGIGGGVIVVGGGVIVVGGGGQFQQQQNMVMEAPQKLQQQKMMPMQATQQQQVVPVVSAVVIAPVVMTVAVPVGGVPGQMIQIQTKDGRTVQVAIPLNSYPGMMFQVQV